MSESQRLAGSVAPFRAGAKGLHLGPHRLALRAGGWDSSLSSEPGRASRPRQPSRVSPGVPAMLSRLLYPSRPGNPGLGALSGRRGQPINAPPIPILHNHSPGSPVLSPTQHLSTQHGDKASLLEIYGVSVSPWSITAPLLRCRVLGNPQEA